MTPLAPLNAARNYKGSIQRKPWEYRVTVTIPHLDTFEMLERCLPLWQQQTEDAYFVIVDTGSPSAETVTALESLRNDNLEVHYIRGHAWKHPSQGISAACDLAMALCRTELLFFTHTDVFVKRDDFLEELCDVCCPELPVVGYEISPRREVDWKGMVGHTATLLHMDTMREKGITWDMDRGRVLFGFDYEKSVGGGWPDTESTLNLLLQQCGITPFLVGHEGNSYHEDDNLIHCRSYTGYKTYRYPGVDERLQWIRDKLRD